MDTQPIPNLRGRWRGVTDDLRAKIQDGRLAHGAMLPSRPELSRRYGVALGTIERAISQLVDERLLVAENGRGTFVAATGTEPLRLLAAKRLGIVCEVSSSVSEGDAHWDTNLLRAVEVAVSSDGGSSLVVDRADPAGPWRNVEDCCVEAAAGGIDALLVIGTGHNEEMADDALRVATRHGVPLVYLVGCALSRPLAQVAMDDFDAGMQAARQLVAAGARTLVCCATSPTRWRDQRIAGVREAARYATTPVVVEALPAQLEDDLPAAAQLCAQRIAALHAAGGAPGLFGINDQAALATLDLLAGMGLGPIPAMGVDDRLAARARGLTTLRPDFTRLGEEACLMLGRVLAGSASRVPLNIPFRLVRRTSTIS